MSTRLKGKQKSKVALAVLLQCAGKGSIKSVPAPIRQPKLILPKMIAAAVNSAVREIGNHER